MTLKLTLKPGQGVYIGNSHIEVVSQAISTLLIEGDEPVLRADYAIAPEAATSAPSRLRLVLQKMYLAANVAAFHDEYFALTRQVLAEQPGALDWIAETNRLLIDGNVYKAIKLAKSVVG